MAPIKITSATLAASLWLTAFAQQPSPDRPTGPPSVTVSAEALVTAEPDLAQIDIGVVTQASSAPEAARQNAEKVSRLMGELRKLLDKPDEIKTVGYALTPNYRAPRDGTPQISGYTASNTLRVTTGDLARVGRVIDAAMKAGANNIDRLLFTLKDEQKAQIEALRTAARKARAKAEETAAALGLRVVRVIALVEGERGFRPMPMQGRMQMETMAAASTPVEAGTIEVRSSVTLTAEISP